MLFLYIILLVLAFAFSTIALLKKHRFRGYFIPARISYYLLLADEILIALKTWYVSAFWTILMIICDLFLIGLLENAFRNKLSNHLTLQFVWVILITFVIGLLFAIWAIKIV